MTQDEIDTMWQQAMRQSIEEGEMFTRYHFAKLVAAKAKAKEREACAHIAEQKIGKTWAAPNSPKEWWEIACKNIAKAIRARGET